MPDRSDTSPPLPGSQSHGATPISDSPANLPVPVSAGRLPLLPEDSDFLEDDHPVATKVEAFLAQAMAASKDRESAAHALVPWMCDVLQSKHSFKAYGRDLVDFVRHMEA